MTSLLATAAGCTTDPSSSEVERKTETVLDDDRVEVRFDGVEYTSFHFADRWDKPCLHPLSTPAGLALTRVYPFQSPPGESQDHAWHRGIIWGHGLINGEDFWRELGRDKTARLVPAGPPSSRVEGEAALIEAQLDMAAPDGESIGTCRQLYRVERTGAGVEVTADIRVLADRGPVTFGDTEDGGFGFRFREEFRQDRGALLLNSDGLEGSENIWGKRARWVQYSAQVDGKPASVTMLDHPSNFRHPTYWHARDYGLCAANPFGLRDFLGDPSQDGSHTIEPGGELAFRYRVVITDGVPAPSDVERFFEAFTV